MSEHLGYSKYDRAETENARNGSFSKNLISENGTIELNVPRDRQGKFEPIRSFALSKVANQLKAI